MYKFLNNRLLLQSLCLIVLLGIGYTIYPINLYDYHDLFILNINYQNFNAFTVIEIVTNLMPLILIVLFVGKDFKDKIIDKSLFIMIRINKREKYVLKIFIKECILVLYFFFIRIIMMYCLSNRNNNILSSTNIVEDIINQYMFVLFLVSFHNVSCIVFDSIVGSNIFIILLLVMYLLVIPLVPWLNNTFLLLDNCKLLWSILIIILLITLVYFVGHHWEGKNGQNFIKKY